MLSNIRESENYEYVVLRRNIHRASIEKALSIVEKYIIEKKLIITGGMSIDLSLKNKGTALYSDKVLPDYDFYSPNFHNDAYAISIILCKAGLKDISVINALHSTTMRVRVNYEAVADVTYIPQNIYDKIPTVKYKDGRIFEHPHYKMINMHIALSYPFADVPFEVIRAGRYKKDMDRYDILSNLYPIKSIMKQLISPKFISKKIPMSILHENCLSGFSALYCWMNFKNFDKKNIYKHIDVKIPHSSTISILSDNPRDVEKKISSLKKNTKTQYYNSLLDNPPKSIVFDTKDNVNIKTSNWEILDNRGKLISATKVGGFWIVNLQFIMAQFLTKYFLDDDVPATVNKKAYIWGYIQSFNLVKKSAEMYASKSSNTDCMKFLPSITTFGKYNIGKSNINSKNRTLFNIGEKSRTCDRPVHLYPSMKTNCKVEPKVKFFNVNKSWIYKIDGSKRDTPVAGLNEM